MDWWEYLKAWMVVGVAVVAALLAIGDWLLTNWTTNVLRNNLLAKRRVRNRVIPEHRGTPPPPSPVSATKEKPVSRPEGLGWAFIAILLWGGLALALIIMASR